VTARIPLILEKRAVIDRAYSGFERVFPRQNQFSFLIRNLRLSFLKDL
jgi:hypothetical protein